MTSKLPINLADLLRQRTIEGERIEYKAGWNPESVLHAMCAFANDFHNLGGGYIVIGVEEKNGQPVLPPKGIDPDSIDGMQKEILNLGHHALRPSYHPLSATYAVEGRPVLILWVPGGETRPYKARVSLSKAATEWAYYIRKQSSTVRARVPSPSGANVSRSRRCARSSLKRSSPLSTVKPGGQPAESAVASWASEPQAAPPRAAAIRSPRTTS